MTIIFFGNTKYSVIGASILHNELEITHVVTVPYSPVAEFAKKNNIPVIYAEKLDAQICQQLQKLYPDFFVVEDYGLFLPKDILALPKYAPLNVHHSLLPKYRGPSPAPSAILAGETISGVTIIKMNDEIDAGDILAQEKYILKANETTDSLLKKLNELGGKLVISVINAYVHKIQQFVSQNADKVTFTQHMQKSDGYINIHNPPDPAQLDLMIRAYYPWPGVWTKIQLQKGKEKIVKLLPDQKLQVEGKKPMNIKDFINGYPDAKEIVEKLLQ